MTTKTAKNLSRLKYQIFLIHFHQQISLLVSTGNLHCLRLISNLIIQNEDY